MVLSTISAIAKKSQWALLQRNEQHRLDAHAREKTTRNTLPQKRVICQANIRQNTWIPQLIKWKIDKAGLTKEELLEWFEKIVLGYYQEVVIKL